MSRAAARPDDRASPLVRWQQAAARRMQATRRATLRLIDRLPEAEVLRPRTQDRWSVKDVLGHLLSCDEETVKRLELIAAGRADRIRWFESMEFANRWNARTVARTRQIGLRPLLRRMEAVRRRLLEAFGRLPATALRDPSHKYPLVEWLPESGWVHEQDHVRAVERWWRSRRGSLARKPAASPSRRRAVSGARGRSPSGRGRRARARRARA